jgi:hypothetical protein
VKEAIQTNDIFRQHYGIIGLRKILSIEPKPPIQEVIDNDLVPILMKFLKQDKEPHL